MSHRDSVTAAPAGARVTASSETTPIAAFEDPEHGLYGVQFHPEVVHTPQGQRILESFLYDVAGVAPAWTPAAVIEEQVERIRAQVGSRARHLRALRRRRLGGRGAARPQGRRRPAHLRVRRPRPAARERGRAGRRDVRPPLPRPARPRRRPRAVPHPPRGGDRARGEARDRRRGVHPRLRGGGAQARRRPLPRPGDALLGRDRVGRRGRRRGEDQVAPQRRRPARRHADGARRAAALAVQGRGAPRRRAARPARADGLAPPVPRPRPRDPDHRRRHRGAARDPPCGRRDPPRGGAPRGPLPRALAVLRGASGDPLGRRPGRRADVRLPDRDPRRHLGGRDDRRLGAPALRAARHDLEPDRQRGARRQPRRARPLARSRPRRSSGSSAQRGPPSLRGVASASAPSSRRAAVQHRHLDDADPEIDLDPDDAVADATARSTPTATASSSTRRRRRTRRPHDRAVPVGRDDATAPLARPTTHRLGRIARSRGRRRASTFAIPRKRATQSSAGRAQSSSGRRDLREAPRPAGPRRGRRARTPRRRRG